MIRQHDTNIIATAIVVGRLNDPISSSVDSFRFSHCTQNRLLGYLFSQPIGAQEHVLLNLLGVKIGMDGLLCVQCP